MKRTFGSLASAWTAMFLLASSAVLPPAHAAETSVSWTVSGHDVFQRADPAGHALYGAGIGSYLFADARVLHWLSLGLGVGYTSYFGSPSFQSSQLDLDGRLFPFRAGKRGEFYLQGGGGLNPLNSSTNSLKGKYHATLGLGYRLAWTGNRSWEFGLHYNAYSPKETPVQSLEARVGLAWTFGRAAQPTVSPKISPDKTAEKAKVKAAATATATATPVPAAPGKPVSAAPVKPAPGDMKKAYDAGVADYKAKDYAASTAALQKAVAIQDPTAKDYFYAEAYALLGTIAQRHSSAPDHLAAARKYYRAALKIDPQTEAAVNGLKSLGNP